MAEFCNQCAKDLKMQTGDFADECKKDELAHVLCEGCGYCWVDSDGYKIEKQRMRDG